MSGVSETLAGRIAITSLQSLSISELQNHYQGSFGIEQLLNWILQGGYPELHAKNLDPSPFFQDYVSTYLERDVRQLLNVRNLRDFDQFMRLLALRSGQIFSMNRLATEIGVSNHTIKNWINVLEASNIIYLLKPFFRNFGKRLVKAPKIYFLDTGLLCYLANITSIEALQNSPLLGAYFETLVLGQILRNGYNSGINPAIYFYRDKDGHEVDFVIPEGNQLRLYECKWNDSGSVIPKNLQKVASTIGQENILNMATITNCPTTTAVMGDQYRLISVADAGKVL